MTAADLLELHVDPELLAVRAEGDIIQARIAAWSPAPMPKDWQPEPRIARTFRTPKPWLRSLR